MAVITICSSLNFYKKAVEAQAKLQAVGHTVIIPATAEKMKASGNYEPGDYRVWLKDANYYHRKTALMHGHFDEVEKSDAILVLNYEKDGKKNYIGGNVLMEMALAFHLKKPIFVLNELPEESIYLEELIGLEPIILKGKLENIAKQLPS